MSTYPVPVSNILDELEDRCDALAREYEQGPCDGPHDPVTWDRINGEFVEAVGKVVADARREVCRYFGEHGWEAHYMTGRLRSLLQVDPATYATAAVERLGNQRGGTISQLARAFTPVARLRTPSPREYRERVEARIVAAEKREGVAK